MVKTGMLTQRQHRVLEILADDTDGLHREFPSCRRRHKRRREHEPFERPQTHTFDKTGEIKVAEDVSLAFIDAISEPVCEEGVVCETLDLLDEKPEGKIRGCIEGSR